MIAVAFDTSTEILSVAAMRDNHLAQVALRAELGHGRHLAPLIRFCMEQLELTMEQLEWVACTRGPGSFTGLRIGMATAKGIASGLQRDPFPLVSVGTLDVIAAGEAHWPGIVLPALDAKKGRFYATAYRAGKPLSGICDAAADELGTMVEPLRASADEHLLLCGPHASLLSAQFPLAHVVASGVAPAPAEQLIRLAADRAAAGCFDNPGDGPEYVRESDARMPS